MSEAAQNPRAERPRTPELTPAQAKSRIDNIRFGWGPRFEQARLDPNNVGDMPQEIFKKSWGAYFSDLSRMSGATTTTQQEIICRGWAEALTVLAKQDPKHEAVESTKKLFGVEDDRLPNARDLINYTSGRLPAPGRRATRPTPEPELKPEAEEPKADIWEAGDIEPEGDEETTMAAAFARAKQKAASKKGEPDKQAEPVKSSWEQERDRFFREEEERNIKQAEAARKKVEEEAALFQTRKQAATPKQVSPARPEPSTPHTSYSAPEADPTFSARRAKENAEQERLAKENAELEQKIEGWQQESADFWNQNWKSVRQHGGWFHRSEPEKERALALGQAVNRLAQLASDPNIEASRLTVEADMLVRRVAKPPNGASRLETVGSFINYLERAKPDFVAAYKGNDKEALKRMKRRVAQATLGSVLNQPVFESNGNKEGIQRLGAWIRESLDEAIKQQ